MSIFSKKIYIDYHYIEHPYQISHLQSFVLSLFLECPAHYNYSLSMHCHNFSNIQVLLSSKSPQVSLPSFLCFNNCCEDGPCYFTQEQKDTESLRDSHQKQADGEKLKPQGARKVEHQGTGGAKMGTGWSILSIFATIPQVNISQYLQVAIFAGSNICRWQYLQVSIFATIPQINICR